jgi:hypothetical protein
MSLAGHPAAGAKSLFHVQNDGCPAVLGPVASHAAYSPFVTSVASMQNAPVLTIPVVHPPPPPLVVLEVVLVLVLDPVLVLDVALALVLDVTLVLAIVLVPDVALVSPPPPAPPPPSRSPTT